MPADVDIRITPSQLETWDAVRPETVAALDLLALTLAPVSGWRIDVVLRNGITLTATPATTTNGDPA